VQEQGFNIKKAAMLYILTEAHASLRRYYPYQVFGYCLSLNVS